MRRFPRPAHVARKARTTPVTALLCALTVLVFLVEPRALKAAPAPAAALADPPAGPPAPGTHPLSDPTLVRHQHRMRTGGWLIGGGATLMGAGTLLVIMGARRDHPEPICNNFYWTGPLLECDGYETQAEFDERRRKATLLKGSGIVGLFVGAATLGTGLGIFLVNRRAQRRRLQEMFGPLQGLSFAPVEHGRGLQLDWKLRF